VSRRSKERPHLPRTWPLSLAPRRGATVGHDMDTQAIASVFTAACALAVAAFVAHRRLAGAGERARCMSMIAFVAGWLAVLTALITGALLLSLRPVSG